MQVDVFVAIDVRAECDVLAIRRKLAAANFPFIVSEPGKFLSRCVEQTNVVVSVRGIRSKKNLPAVGREVAGEIEMLSIMRCQQRALSGCDLGDEDIGVSSFGLLLCVDDALAVLRPNG